MTNTSDLGRPSWCLHGGAADGRRVHRAVGRVRLGVITIALVFGSAACSTSAQSTPPTTVEQATTSSSGTATTTVTTSVTTAASTPITTTPPTTRFETVPTTSEDSSGDDTTAADESSDPTLAQQADIDLASTALITIDDFPDGWTERTDDGDGATDDDLESRFDDCLGREGETVNDGLADLMADSPEFAGPTANPPTVRHSVALAPDAGTAIAAMAEHELDRAADCLEDVVASYFAQQLEADTAVPDGVEVDEVSIERTDDGTAPDEVLGYTIVIPLLFGEDTLAYYLEVLYQRDGRALSSLDFSSFGAPFDRGGYGALRNAAANRLALLGT